jgi:hypothetical protein
MLVKKIRSNQIRATNPNIVKIIHAWIEHDRLYILEEPTKVHFYPRLPINQY